jgi:hypothetical protein
VPCCFQELASFGYRDIYIWRKYICNLASSLLVSNISALCPILKMSSFRLHVYVSCVRVQEGKSVQQSLTDCWVAFLKNYIVGISAWPGSYSSCECC